MTSAIEALIEAEQLPPDYATIVERHWRPLARQIADRVAVEERPLIVGINGAQGSGKSTLCRFLEVLLQERGLHAATLSLDDIYCTRAERQRLAATTHPLFATRGVPGTHDTAIAMAIFDDVLARREVFRPRFDKAADDRAPDLVGPERGIEVLLFEGWCVGAVPQAEAELAQPINALEAQEDADGVWRREVNHRLAADYAALFARLDMLVMLQVPGFEVVRANRLLQERKLAARAPDGTAVMDAAAIDRFIAHYERLTRHMLEEMPGRADIVIRIDNDQRPLDPSAGSAAMPTGN
ncbi:kinase [Altererythrobacter sp. B11]|uniref:kinase n=1 Tax=Altererythrobacter sp. B11 TaxID=2060312 RepID=UPI000DC6EEE6|nr:kinase [Altererythrobacter sp. B11]BBC73888.1 kinase [Altererythrobacter sp. B11]